MTRPKLWIIRIWICSPLTPFVLVNIPLFIFFPFLQIPLAKRRGSSTSSPETQTRFDWATSEKIRAFNKTDYLFIVCKKKCAACLFSLCPFFLSPFPLYHSSPASGRPDINPVPTFTHILLTRIQVDSHHRSPYVQCSPLLHVDIKKWESTYNEIQFR